MNVKSHKVSSKYAKQSFNTIGLFLILYALFALFIPYALHMYMVISDSSIMKDEFMYYGIYFIIILFGTIIPFFLMRKTFKISLKSMARNISASFIDLFVQTIVVFTLCIALTYVSNIIFSNFGIESKLISSIGFSYDEANLNNILYVFMLIIVTPLIEEYAFRGVLLNALSKYGKNFALYTSAFIFAIAHLNLVEFIPAFAMGVLLGKISLRYKSIIPTIMIHILFDGLIYALCVIPANITRYMAYGLVAIIAIAVFLIISGRYERIRIQKFKSSKTAFKLFFTSPSVIFAIVLLLLDTALFMYY